jgi:hypothetical protein
MLDVSAVSNISTISNIPIYSIFILILILSGGYTIELIPCRLKKLLTENIFIKHFFCLLTLIFFISITDSSYDGKNLMQIIFHSFLLYILFMFIIKTQYKFFVVILILLAIIYLIKIKNDEINQDIKNIENDSSNQNTMNLSKQKVDKKNLNLNKDSSIFSETNMKENPKNNIEQYIKLEYKLVKIKNILIIITLILIFIGFFVYLGQKKYEYKNKFSYTVFLFGVTKCKNTIDNDLSIKKSLQYLFTT